MAGLRSVTVDDLRRFHRDFYGASNAEIVVVGDFDADAIRAEITEKLDAWRSPKPYTEITTPFFLAESGSALTTTAFSAAVSFLPFGRAGIASLVSVVAMGARRSAPER